MRALRHFLSHWQNVLGLILLAGFVFVALAAPYLSPEDPEHPGPVKTFGRATDYQPKPPGPLIPLGTLPGQISVYHSLIWGTRSALVFGLLAVTFTLLLGVLVGTISAYAGGFLENLLMRITDGFLSFPVIAGVVLFQQLLSIALEHAGAYYTIGGMGATQPMAPGYVVYPENMPLWLLLFDKLNPVMAAFVLFSWMPYARMMNTMVHRVKEMGYIQAARALGSGHGGLIFRHMIPNAITPVVVLAARDVGGMVLLQATFTYIGLGGNSIWGMLLVKGRDWIVAPGGLLDYWWAFLPATLALVLFGIAWNLVGDGLNEALNPRTR